MCIGHVWAEHISTLSNRWQNYTTQAKGKKVVHIVVTKNAGYHIITAHFICVASVLLSSRGEMQAKITTRHSLHFVFL